MPNVLPSPAGTQPFVNLAPTPTFMWQPPVITGTSYHVAGVELFNAGQFPVYIGQSNVSPLNGVLLAPGQKMELRQWTAAVYGCVPVAPYESAVINTNYTVSATLSSSPATAGSTTFVMAASVPNGFTQITNAVFWLGNAQGATAGAAEVLQVSSVSGSTITTTSPCFFDHPASSLATIATNYWSAAQEGGNTVPNYVTNPVKVNVGLVR